MNNENSKAKKIALLALVFAIIAIGSVESGIGTTLSNMQCIELISTNGTYWNMIAEDAGIVFDAGRCMGVNGSVIYPQFNETQLQHNNLSGLQGGEGGNYFHISETWYDIFQYTETCAPNHYLSFDYGATSFQCKALPTDNLSWKSEKVNKSGDTMTGDLVYSSGSGFVLNDQSNTRNIALDMDYDSSGSGGSYVTIHPLVSGQAAGINIIPKGNNGAYMYFYGSDYLADTSNYQRMVMSIDPTNGFKMYTQVSGTYPTANFTFGTIPTISGLSGSGNAFACLNSIGKLYRSTTACV